MIHNEPNLTMERIQIRLKKFDDGRKNMLTVEIYTYTLIIIHFFNYDLLIC